MAQKTIQKGGPRRIAGLRGHRVYQGGYPLRCRRVAVSQQIESGEYRGEPDILVRIPDDDRDQRSERPVGRLHVSWLDRAQCGDGALPSVVGGSNERRRGGFVPESGQGGRQDLAVESGIRPRHLNEFLRALPQLSYPDAQCVARQYRDAADLILDTADQLQHVGRSCLHVGYGVAVDLLNRENISPVETLKFGRGA